MWLPTLIELSSLVTFATFLRQLDCVGRVYICIYVCVCDYSSEELIAALALVVQKNIKLHQYHHSQLAFAKYMLKVLFYKKV
jgi:hypothetical protein